MARQKSTSTELTNWDEELAQYAKEVVAMEANAGGGQFFSLRGGQLTWQDAPLPDNQMAVIIVDHILENVYFRGPYDPDTPQGPTCYAYGRDDKTMAPHEMVVAAGHAQHEQCEGCPKNEWGSADTGRGKACRNTRRLALISAGEFAKGQFQLNGAPENYRAGAVGFLKLPVTSVKGFATYVKQVAGVLNRPPFGVVTKIKLVPDPKSQFMVLFEAITEVPSALLGPIMERRKVVVPTINFPYPDFEEEAASPKPKVAKKRAKRY